MVIDRGSRNDREWINPLNFIRLSRGEDNVNRYGALKNSRNIQNQGVWKFVKMQSATTG